jgi:hypothetical protein
MSEIHQIEKGISYKINYTIAEVFKELEVISG